MDYQTNWRSPLGELTLASDGERLVGLWLRGQKYFAATLEGEARVQDDLRVFCRAREWLQSYFAGERPAPDALPLAPRGSAFRREVWRMLCEIPWGEVTTYGALARRLGPGMSAQAVGGAVGHNPISIIIPCHRVVGADGNLTGYAGGVENKLRLLRLEGADLSRLRVPGRGTAL